MKLLSAITILVAILLALGEVARWWSDPRFLPLAFDELFVAAAMIGAALSTRWWGTASLVAAWGMFCGLVLGLLVSTLDHLFHGPPKQSAAFYAVILAGLLAVGFWATRRALILCGAATRER